MAIKCNEFKTRFDEFEKTIEHLKWAESRALIDNPHIIDRHWAHDEVSEDEDYVGLRVAGCAELELRYVSRGKIQRLLEEERNEAIADVRSQARSLGIDVDDLLKDILEVQDENWHFTKDKDVEVR